MVIIQKTYEYKVFSPTGTYKGLLQNVLPDFNYNQNMYTTFAQLEITVAQSADTSNQQPPYLTTEGGSPLTTEDGKYILVERVPDVVGSTNSGALIANDNLIVVYEYSIYYPNGLQVFSGYISKWKAVYGSDNNIVVTCISNGQDLSQYVVTSGSSSVALLPLSDTAQPGGTWGTAFAQIITPSTTLTFQQIQLFLGCSSGSTFVTAQLCLGNPANDSITIMGGIETYNFGSGNSLIDTTNTVNINNPTPATQTFTFPSVHTLVSGGSYYVLLNFLSFEFGNLLLQGAGAADLPFSYTNFGQEYQAIGIANNSTFSMAYNSSYPAMYLNLLATTGSTNAAYSLTDPSSILTSIMSSYIAAGGDVSMPVGGYLPTGVLQTYTFKVQTLQQAITTLQSLAPANWYWYVDPATNVLQWAQLSTTADITIIKGRHINALEIEATKENIKNTAYFTGGDDGTNTQTNIFVVETVPLNNNRVGLSILSDNRVNSTSGGVGVANSIALGNLLQNQAETFQTTITIQDGTIDINLLKLGKVLGFAGFGTFPDKLLLEIVGVNRTSDQVTLQVGTLPKRSSKQLADIQTALAYLQTVANPSMAA